MEQSSSKRKEPEFSGNEALQSTAIDPTIAPKQGQSSESELSQSTTIEPTPTGINRLTFDCLHLIFLRLPLRTLLQIRPVSRTWNSTVIYICAHKKRLTLAVYSPPPNNQPFNPLVPLAKSESDLFWIDNLSGYVLDRTENPLESVHFPIGQLTKQSTVGLAQLFTGLNELSICFDCHGILQSYLAKIEFLFRLLSSSSPNLGVISLILSFKDKNCYPQTGIVKDALCKIASNITIGRLAHLKQLDLCISGDFGSYSFLPLYSTLDFQAKKYDDMFAQLERFTLNYQSPSWDTESTLAKLESRLVSLSLNITNENHNDLAPLISMFDNVKFVTSLAHLRLSLQGEALNFIQALCERFQTLKSVQLQIVAPQPCPDNYRNDFDNQLIRPLATLQHLSELRLHDFDVPLISGNLSLPRVTKLTLCKRNLIATDANAFCRTLITQFPNLEELVLVGRPFGGIVHENARVGEVEQQIQQQFEHVRSIVCDLTAPEWR